MLHVSGKGLVKKYTGNTVFSKIDLDIPFKSKLAIVGPNGSGKTTLLQIFAGLSLPSSGKVFYFKESKEIEGDDWYKEFTFCSAYQELIEEFSAKEIAEFHFSLKKPIHSIRITDFLQLVRLDKESNKPIKFYSTGMKQRLKLGLSICSNCPILFLDEPTSNLDKANFQWYIEMMNNYTKDKTIIISSNLQEEYSFCDKIINIMDYK